MWETIKQALKRDLRNWEQKKRNRAKAGKLGGIKSGESRRSEANEASASKTKQNEANEAVIVSGSGSVSVIGSGSDEYDGRQQMLYEMLSRATMGVDYEESFLRNQVNLFLNKYPNCVAVQSGGLINSWAARLSKEEQEKWKNQRNSKTGKRQVAV